MGRRPTIWAMAVSAIIGLCAVGCGPVWWIDPEYGERLAKQENKPILFYFKAWDSTSHRNMRLQVLDSADVKRELMGTINIELEYAFFPHYAKRYGVKNPQVCVLARPDGRQAGASLYANPVPSAAAFVEWIRRAKDEATPVVEPAVTQPEPDS